MNSQFNLKLQSWLNDDNRTIEEGCLLLLQMENNQIHYQNLLRHPNRDAVMKFLLSELQKRLKVRLANITHQEVAEMEEQVKVIVKEHFAFLEAKEGKTSRTSDEEFRKGKRADHDQLPEEIQARYIENLDLLHKMRELHLKLRSLSTEQVSCPDSERYPFLKELIALDKQLHENWKVYDHFVLEANGTSDHVSTSSEKSGTAEDNVKREPLTEEGRNDEPEDETSGNRAEDVATVAALKAKNVKSTKKAKNKK